MTGDEYKQALIELGITQAAFGAWVGVHGVTGKTWARRGPPKPVAKWVSFLLAHRKRTISEAELDRLQAALKNGDELEAQAIRRLIGELKGLRQAMGDEPVSWRTQMVSRAVQSLPQQS